MKNIYPVTDVQNKGISYTLEPSQSPNLSSTRNPVAIHYRKKVEESNKELLKSEMKYQAIHGSMKTIYKSLSELERVRDINLIKAEIYKIKKSIAQQVSTDQRWESFQNHFDLVQSDFYKTIKAQYNTLTLVDLELCAYLRMEMSTKDIARQLNLSIRGVETRKYRLKKKLSLQKAEDLNNFISNI